MEKRSIAATKSRAGGSGQAARAVKSAGSAPRRSRSTPFRLVGGSPALDLVNTVNWTARGLERELIGTYDDLVRWGEVAGAITGEAAAGLRAAARRDPERAAVALERAHALRETLKRLFDTVAAGGPPEGEVLRRFNEALGESQVRLYVAWDGRTPGEAGYGWSWRGMGEDPESVLWPVARAAADLLASGEVGRVRVCAGDDCGWIYVDRSRNGLRRWCEMRTCGSVAKSRRYYRRKRGTGRAGES